MKFLNLKEAAATEQSQARIAELEAENARLKNDRVNGYTVESGGVNYAVIRNALSKISGMPAMAYATMEHIDHIAATIAQQAEKFAATEKDAERYRWLRQQQIDLKAPALGVLNHGVFIGKIPDNVVLSEADADAAIDEAREGK